MQNIVSVATLLAFASNVLAWGAPGYRHGAPWVPPAGPPTKQDQKWNLPSFDSLVAFGDSYTDDTRRNYFTNHSGMAPPVGWVEPVNYKAADGGRVWVEYIKQYTGVNLYNYAVSGAACSNNIAPRYDPAINALLPDIAGYELPAYIADSKYYYENGTKFMDDSPDTTVYVIWIGTNELGYAAIIQDAQVKGTTIVTYTNCVYNQLSAVYANGGRYFVILNVAPLNLSPAYGLPGHGGLGSNPYWPDKSNYNITEISGRMLEQVVTVNEVYRYRTPFDVVVNQTYPGASFAVFDVHGLMTDIYYNPSQYLNGTPPLNVTGFINHCNATGGDCVPSANPDSYMWFDQLHPSEQTERIIAQNFLDVVKGNSTWATYWTS